MVFPILVENQDGVGCEIPVSTVMAFGIAEAPRLLSYIGKPELVTLSFFDQRRRVGIGEFFIRGFVPRDTIETRGFVQCVARVAGGKITAGKPHPHSPVFETERAVGVAQ